MRVHVGGQVGLDALVLGETSLERLGLADRLRARRRHSRAADSSSSALRRARSRQLTSASRASASRLRSRSPSPRTRRSSSRARADAGARPGWRSARAGLVVLDTSRHAVDACDEGGGPELEGLHGRSPVPGAELRRYGAPMQRSCPLLSGRGKPNTFRWLKPNPAGRRGDPGSASRRTSLVRRLDSGRTTASRALGALRHHRCHGFAQCRCTERLLEHRESPSHRRRAAPPPRWRGRT